MARPLTRSSPREEREPVGRQARAQRHGESASDAHEVVAGDDDVGGRLGRGGAGRRCGDSGRRVRLRRLARRRRRRRGRRALRRGDHAAGPPSCHVCE